MSSEGHGDPFVAVHPRFETVSVRGDSEGDEEALTIGSVRGPLEMLPHRSLGTNAIYNNSYMGLTAKSALEPSILHQQKGSAH